MPDDDTTPEGKRAKIRAWRDAHRAEIAAKVRAYKDAHRAEIAAKERAYREANRERIVAYKKSYREANRTEGLAANERIASKKYRDVKRVLLAPHRKERRDATHQEAVERRIANRDAIREKDAARARTNREANREKYAARERAWQIANPDKVRAVQHARRARKIGNGGTYTADEWQALCDWFGNICLRCGVAGKLSVDHVIPLAKGGSNDIGNLQPLCKPCNSAKSVKMTDYRDPDRLAAFLQSLIP